MSPVFVAWNKSEQQLALPPLRGVMRTPDTPVANVQHEVNK